MTASAQGHTVVRRAAKNGTDGKNGANYTVNLLDGTNRGTENWNLYIGNTNGWYAPQDNGSYLNASSGESIKPYAQSSVATEGSGIGLSITHSDGTPVIATDSLGIAFRYPIAADKLVKGRTYTLSFRAAFGGTKPQKIICDIAPINGDKLTEAQYITQTALYGKHSVRLTLTANGTDAAADLYINIRFVSMTWASSGGQAIFLGDIKLEEGENDNPVWTKSEADKVGADGKDAQSQFVSTVFLRQDDTPDTPQGGSFDEPLPDGEQWSDGIPSGVAKLWYSHRRFTSDGASPQEDTWTTPAVLADSADFDVEYCAKAKYDAPPQGHPNTNTEWSNDATEDAVWMATCSKSANGDWSEWIIAKIKGENGDDAVRYWLDVSPMQIALDADGNAKSSSKVTINIYRQVGGEAAELITPLAFDDADNDGLFISYGGQGFGGKLATDGTSTSTTYNVPTSTSFVNFYLWQRVGKQETQIGSATVTLTKDGASGVNGNSYDGTESYYELSSNGEKPPQYQRLNNGDKAQYGTDADFVRSCWQTAPMLPTDDNPYLWQVDIVCRSSYDSDGNRVAEETVTTPHIAAVKGSKGASGENVWRIDLDNENVGVPCDAAGNPTVDLSKITSGIEVYNGRTVVSLKDGWTVSCAVSGCTAEIVDNTMVRLTELTADIGTITVTAQNATLGISLSATMTATKVYAGANGEPAVIHSIGVFSDAQRTIPVSHITYSTESTESRFTPDAIYICKYKDGQLTGEGEVTIKCYDSSGTCVYTTGIGSSVENDSQSLYLTIDESWAYISISYVSDTDGTFYDGETIPIVADGRELVTTVESNKSWISSKDAFISGLETTYDGVRSDVSTIKQTSEEISLRVNTAYTTHNLLKRTNRGTENWHAWLYKNNSDGTATYYTRKGNVWSIKGYDAKIMEYTDDHLYNGGPGMLFVPYGSDTNSYYYKTMVLLYPIELAALSSLTTDDYLMLSFRYLAATMTYQSRIRAYIAKYSYNSNLNCPYYLPSSGKITSDATVTLSEKTFTQAEMKLQLKDELPTLSGSEAIYVVLEFQHYDSVWSSGMQFAGAVCGNKGNFFIGDLQLEKGAKRTVYTPSDIVDENAAYATGIDIVNKRVTITADNFRVQGTNGDTIVTAALVDKKGKLNADLIEAKHFRATNADGNTVLSLNEDNNKAMTVYHDNGNKAMEVTLSTLVVNGKEDICVTKVYNTNGKLVRALCIKNGWINTDTVGNAPEKVELIVAANLNEVKTTSNAATTFYKLIDEKGNTCFYTDVDCLSLVTSTTAPYLVIKDITRITIGNMSLSDLISANNAANAGFQTNGISSSSSSTATTYQRGYYSINSEGKATFNTMTWQE
jgi:hypothetical protein